MTRRVLKRGIWPAFGFFWACAAWAVVSLPVVAQGVDAVRLGTWAIDRTEVTIGQFERYVRATQTVTRAEKEGGGFEFGAGWERRPGWTWRKPDGVAASADLPAVHLDFAEAQAYCQWAGGRLPTGAEWQQAGFTEMRDAPPKPWVKGRTYPFATGDSPQGANTSDPDPWPRAAPAGATRQGVNGLYRHGRQCVGMDHRCARQRTPHGGRLLVVRRLQHEGRCAGLQAR